MNEQEKKAMDEMAKSVVEGLTPVIEKSVKEETDLGIEEIKKASNERLDANEEAMKNLQEDVSAIKISSKKIVSKSLDKETEALAKTAIVNIFKGIKTANVGNEVQFKSVFDAVIKETFQNETTATDGAEFVFEQFEKGVYSIFEQYPLLNELDTIQLVSGKSITLPTYDGGVEAYWLDEGANYTASKGDTGNIKTDIYKLGALVTLTDEMLEDDMTIETLYNLIIKEAGTKMAKKLENEILNGNATTGKMKGILTKAGLLNHTSTATEVADLSDVDFATADGKVDEKFDINPNNKIAVMKKATKNALMVARDGNGALIFPEIKATGEVFGHRIVTARSMPANTTGNVAVLLGNVRDFYRHVSRKGFTAEMGHIAGDFQAGKKTVRMDRRDGGQPIDGTAFVTITLG